MPYDPNNKPRFNLQMGFGRLASHIGFPSIPERILDGIPGFVAWSVLIVCVISAIFAPWTLLTIASLMVAYSAVRFVIAWIGNVRGLTKVREAQSTDWHAAYNRDAKPDAIPWEDVHHVVIIPNYNEPEEVLAASLEQIARSTEATDHITVVLAMEANEPDSIHKAESLQARYESLFAHFFFTVHPRGLPGETQCKSANQAWAARWVKRKLVDRLGYNMDHIVITTMDSDTLWHEQYFSALTYYFSTNPKRHHRIWQAPIRYHSNVQRVNPLIRLVYAYSTAFEMAYLSISWWLALPMSSYSLSLSLLDSSDYWDPDVIADEWHMFIKLFFANEGNVAVQAIYLPFLATAVTGTSLRETVVNRYRQSLRHSWGSKEVGYTVAQLVTTHEAGWRSSLRLLMRVAHDIMHSGAGWIMVTLGTQLPLLLHPPLLERHLNDPFSVKPFVILNISFFIILLLGALFWGLDVKLRPPISQKFSLAEMALIAFGFLLLPMLTLLFVALPILHAQMLLLLGRTLDYRVTPKL